jgi:hypothetical protein
MRDRRRLAGCKREGNESADDDLVARAIGTIAGSCSKQIDPLALHRRSKRSLDDGARVAMRLGCVDDKWGTFVSGAGN